MNSQQRLSSIKTAWVAGYLYAGFRILELLVSILRYGSLGYAFDQSQHNIIIAIVILVLCTMYRHGSRFAMLLLPVAAAVGGVLNYQHGASLLRISIDGILFGLFVAGAIAVLTDKPKNKRGAEK